MLCCCTSRYLLGAASRVIFGTTQLVLRPFARWSQTTKHAGRRGWFYSGSAGFLFWLSKLGGLLGYFCFVDADQGYATFEGPRRRGLVTLTATGASVSILCATCVSKRNPPAQNRMLCIRAGQYFESLAERHRQTWDTLRHVASLDLENSPLRTSS